MSEPTRFIGSGGLKGKLLASAKEDRPPKGARHRAILAAAAAAAASTKAASATATLSATASSLGRWAVLKWIAVGALGAGTMVAAKAVILPRPPADSTIVTVSQTTRTNPPAPRARRDATPAAPPSRDSTSQEAWSLIPPPAQEPPPFQDAPPLTSSASPASPPRVDDTRAAVATPRPPAPIAVVAPPATLHVEAREPQSRAERQPPRPAASGSAARGSDGSGLAPSSSTAVASSSTLASEIAAIDQAKRALADGDAAEALRRVDAYSAAFPVGILAAEANALRIEALARAGRLDEARVVLARLRTSHPFSPLLENLGHLVGE